MQQYILNDVTKEFSKEDCHHILNVLRMNDGDNVSVCFEDKCYLVKLVINDNLVSYEIINEIESYSRGDHDTFKLTLRFLMYKFLKELQKPKASLQLPDFAPKLVVLIASKVPAFSMAVDAYIKPLQSLGKVILKLELSCPKIPMVLAP